MKLTRLIAFLLFFSFPLSKIKVGFSLKREQIFLHVGRRKNLFTTHHGSQGTWQLVMRTVKNPLL